MRNYEFDVYFQLMTLGDRENYDNFYLIFRKSVKAAIREELRKFPNHYLTDGDFPEMDIDLFIHILKNFEPGRKKLKPYINFLISKRLPPMIKKKLFDIDQLPLSLDTTTDDKPLYDFIEDKSVISPQTHFIVNKVSYEISSPNGKGKKNRVRAKMNAMLLAGYTKEEIMKKLKLSERDIRTLKNMNKNDVKLQNLKLELK